MATYTKNPTADGNVQILKDGQVVSTAAASAADSIISSMQGADTAPTKTGNPIVDSGIRRETGANASNGSSAYDTTAASIFGSMPITPPDAAAQEATRQQQLKAIQAQLDATDATYAGILGTVQAQGVDRLGQGRAISARKGILTSDMGTRVKEDITQKNNAAESAVLAERDAKKAALIDAANQRAFQISQLETTKALTNASNYLTYLKQKQDEGKQGAVDYFKTGGTIDQLDDTAYSNMLKSSGLTPEQFKALSILNKPQDTVLTSFTQGNKYYTVSKDPITGKQKTESIDLGFTVPPEYNTTKLDDGTVLFTPQKWDPNKSMKDQIMTYGSPSASYKLDEQYKVLRNQKIQQDLKAEDTSVVTDLQDAAAAIDAGADADKVRQRFLDTHPTKGDLFIKYTKQAY